MLQLMEKYSEDNKIPICEKETLQTIASIIEKRKVNMILEIGTAIGYSSIFLAQKSQANIVTIERDQKVAEIAQKFISQSDVHDKIKVIISDALLLDSTNLGKFDLIFIDAAKAQNINFFKKYENNLAESGIILVDNLNFHNLRLNQSEKLSRNIKQLVRKLQNFIDYMEENEKYNFDLINVGDGLGVITKK